MMICARRCRTRSTIEARSSLEHTGDRMKDRMCYIFTCIKACSDSLPSTTLLPELEERQFKIAEWGKRRSTDSQISRSRRITEQPLSIILEWFSSSGTFLLRASEFRGDRCNFLSFCAWVWSCLSTFAWSFNHFDTKAQLGSPTQFGGRIKS